MPYSLAKSLPYACSHWSNTKSMVKYFKFFSLLTHRERRRAIVANSSVTPCTAVKQLPTSPYTVRFIFRMYLIRQSPFSPGRICLKIEPYSYLIVAIILQRPKNGGKFRLSKLDYTSWSRKPKTLPKNLFYYNYRVQYKFYILWKKIFFYLKNRLYEVNQRLFTK